jgi:hypothetical protein
MNGNIEKILYIGVGVLLLGVAFMFFFSGYNLCKNYVEKNNEILSEDRMVTISKGKDNFEIRGAEVIHQVIQAKKLEEQKRLSELYSDSIVSYQSSAQIWISGRNTEEIKTSDIDEDSFYDVEIKKDFFGRITEIKYNLR